MNLNLTGGLRTNLRGGGLGNPTSAALLQLQADLDSREREILQEAADLSGSMDDKVKQAIIDYLNLVFGAGQETEDFWATILLPYASHYFAYPFEDLQRSPKLLNAIFFAFSDLFGLKIEGKHVLIQTGAAKRS